jgi:competence protein ComEC
VIAIVLALFALLTPLAQQPAPKAVARTLDVYFIDVEGGQATLIVTPERETLLIDAGFPGRGTGGARPGDPRIARDPQRILAAARDAGVTRIDYLLITHFHPDHMGGVPELAQLLPIGTFIDHGDVPPAAEQIVNGTIAGFRAYAAERAKGKHLEPAPGDRLPIKGVDAHVVSSAGAILSKPFAGGGLPNSACTTPAIAEQELVENPRSTGVVIQFGRFRMLDVGDLTGKPFADLVCPINRIGPVDLYLVSHHAGADAAHPATFAAWRPRVAVINNGAVKGGAPEVVASLRRSPGLEDVWQLHRSELPGAQNFADSQIANLDARTSHWIKLRAFEDGSFTITNGRTGVTKRYPAR